VWYPFRSWVLILGWILASETSATPLWLAIVKALVIGECEQLQRYIWVVTIMVIFWLPLWISHLQPSFLCEAGMLPLLIVCSYLPCSLECCYCILYMHIIFLYLKLMHKFINANACRFTIATNLVELSDFSPSYWMNFLTTGWFLT